MDKNYYLMYTKVNVKNKGSVFMNIYEDYAKYILDNDSLLRSIQSDVPSVYVLVEDVIQVLDYVVKEKKKNSKIDEDLNSFFTAGYNYLTSVINEMKIMYVDYFKSNIETFSKYSQLIVYFFYIDDLKGHLDAMDKLSKANRQLIDEIQLEIEHTLVRCDEVDPEKIQHYENVIEQLDFDKSYHPIYTIFAMVREELHLY